MAAILYSDGLISIDEGSITFRRYYFPSYKSKTVPLSDIADIAVKPPTIFFGKWRIHGTGNFRTWYPEDRDRPKRDRIFLLRLRDRWIRIGFTAEDGERAERVLRAKNLIQAET